MKKESQMLREEVSSKRISRECLRETVRVCVCIRSNFVAVKEREREREIQCKENRERKDNTSGW